MDGLERSIITCIPIIHQCNLENSMQPAALAEHNFSRVNGLSILQGQLLKQKLHLVLVIQTVFDKMQHYD